MSEPLLGAYYGLIARWILVAIMAFVLNKILIKYVAGKNRPIVLPIALQGAYALLPVFLSFILGLTSFYTGEGLSYVDAIIILLLIAGLIWLFRKPSYGAVVILAVILLSDVIYRFSYLYFSGVMLLAPSYATLHIIDIVSVFFFSVAVTVLMFFRVSKILSTE